MPGDNSDLTAQQRTAVELANRRCGVLAAASAGTGKSTVMARAVVAQVLDLPPAERCDIHELLVLTFGRGAIAEMRERIADALRGRAAAGDDPRRIERQLILLDRAEISTVHAFCGSMLREDYRELGLDPAFEILSEGPSDLLRRQAVVDAFAAAYADPTPFRGRFEALVETYGENGGDENLIETVLSLDDFLAALVDPAGWIRGVRRASAFDGKGPLPGERELRERIDRDLKSFAARIDGLRGRIAGRPQVDFRRYPQYLVECADLVAGIQKRLPRADLDVLIKETDGLRFPDRPRLRAADPKIAAELRDLHAETAGWPKDAGAFRDRYSGISRKQAVDDLLAVGPHLRTLLEVVERFVELHSRRKSDRNVLDYADLERLALKLLCGESSPDPQTAARPADAAVRRRERFRYVLVDEYQDVNPVQDAILRLVSRDSTNLFLVGDFKQSIYGFRQAMPEIFQERRRCSVPADADPAVPGMRHVTLATNFRSRRGIVDGVNAVMARIMTVGSAGIAYADSGPLELERPYPEPQPGVAGVKSPAVEAYLLEGDRNDDNDDANGGDDDEPTVHREGEFVADRIRRMVEGREFSIMDGTLEQPHHRPVRWRDIVILLRSAAGRLESFADGLRRVGIPLGRVRAGTEPSVERRDVVSLFAALDNPRDDLALLGLMRSPLVGFTDVELVEIRLAAPQACWFDAVAGFAARSPASGPAEKCAAALRQLDDWRTQLRRRGPTAALGRVYRETGYPTYVLALPGGRRRRAELLSMLDVCAAFERSSDDRSALADHLAGGAKAAGEDRSGAALDPEEDVVRIMTIHGAKGLEFPVVFLADLAKGFNFLDAQGSFLWSAGSGLAASAIHPESWTRSPTLLHRAIADQRRAACRREEMRLLYTAMTRAKECLVLTAAPSSRNRRCRETFPGRVGALPDAFLTGAACAADWVFPAASCGDPGTPALLLPTVAGTTTSDPPAAATEPIDPFEAVREKLADGEPTGIPGELSQTGLEMLARLEWRYPHLKLAAVPAHRSVTELRAEAAADTDDEGAASVGATASYRPRFMSEGPQQPAANEIGTAVHCVLEHVDLAGPIDAATIRALVESLVAAGRIPPTTAAAVPVPWIVRFYEGEAGRFLRLHAASVQREVPITFAMTAGELRPDLPPADRGRTVLVRGVIDALVEHDGGFRILDYKTDAIGGGDPSTKIAEYRPQLELYRRAVEAIWGRPVRRATLCFLSFGKDEDLWG